MYYNYIHLVIPIPRVVRKIDFSEVEYSQTKYQFFWTKILLISDNIIVVPGDDDEFSGTKGHVVPGIMEWNSMNL